MIAIKAFFKVELKALLREPVTIFFMIILPIILTIVFGSTFGDEPIAEGSDVLGIDLVIPINIVFLLANAGLMGIPITISEVRSQMALKRYFTLPISYYGYFISLGMTFAFVSFISTLIFGAISYIFYKASFWMNAVHTILFIVTCFLILYVFFIGGYLIALNIKNTRTTNIVSTISFLAMVFSSGVAIPLESMPKYIQNAADVLPMSHSIKILQDLWINEINYSDRFGDYLYLLVVAILFTLFVKWRRLKWD
ncbi:ABC transporter permease [Fervidibacillus albus]|uniref:Transport permease protein n=1 Tax=Fervidibacillus albus TaxID=2980026 RepID=A0A9E8RW95_9BACI|nr:ABC transporter permease [Fervidibacillus albus]WAA09828.1 ABC transporter permease [Fervidibacillus albus]